NPDGTMVTTYHLRDKVRWHDGTPVTAQDFVFSNRILKDATLPIQDRAQTRQFTSVEARDDSTVVITWSGPYIFANLLGGKDIYPLPRHQLEGKYESDPSNFATGSEWTSAFIGAGPFRVQSWEPGVAIQA